jgi:hypothetical protein
MLCELNDLKTRLKIAEADVVDDAVLEGFIAAVSGRFAKECNRQFAYAAGATFEFRADEMDLLVDRFPLITVSAFHLKSTEAEGFVVQTSPDYLLNPTKSIIELASCLGTSRQIGRVTFTGGYVLPGGTVGAGQTALPDEVEQAAIEQCAYFFQRKDQLGLTSVSGGDGSISQFSALDLLPPVKAMLKKYERWRP